MARLFERAALVLLCSSLAGGLSVGACSDDDTKRSRNGDDAGLGDGSVSSGGAGQAGSAGAAGQAGSGGAAGIGGTGAAAGTGGNAGTGATAGSANAGGTGGIPTDASADADASRPPTDLFVSTTGNDLGAGTRADPFAALRFVWYDGATFHPL